MDNINNNNNQKNYEKKFGLMKAIGKEIYVVVVMIWVHVNLILI
jgi:hypothetical protein